MRKVRDFETLTTALQQRANVDGGQVYAVERDGHTVKVRPWPRFSGASQVLADGFAQWVHDNQDQIIDAIVADAKAAAIEEAKAARLEADRKLTELGA